MIEQKKLEKRKRAYNIKRIIYYVHVSEALQLGGVYMSSIVFYYCFIKE